MADPRALRGAVLETLRTCGIGLRLFRKVPSLPPEHW